MKTSITCCILLDIQNFNYVTTQLKIDRFSPKSRFFFFRLLFSFFDFEFFFFLFKDFKAACFVLCMVINGKHILDAHLAKHCVGAHLSLTP